MKDRLKSWDDDMWVLAGGHFSLVDKHLISTNQKYSIFLQTEGLKKK